jgi:hypothetical protein
MLKRILLSLALVSAAAPPCAAAADPVPAPAVQAQPKASPEQLAAARELLDAIGAKDMITKTFETLGPLEAAEIRRRNPNVSEKALTAFSTAMREELAASNGQLIDICAELYAEHFTTDELHQITAFYRSDVGRKFAATAPQMMQELMPIARHFGQEVGRRVEQRVNEQLKTQGETL